MIAATQMTIVCACVRPCMRACVRECVRAHVCLHSGVRAGTCILCARLTFDLLTYNDITGNKSRPNSLPVSFLSSNVVM